MQKIKRYDIKSGKLYEVILFIIMSLMMLNIILLNIFKLDDFLHSDMVAEMSYIKTVCEQGSILPFEWIHSQELFINRPIYISAPLYLITGNLMLSYQLSIIVTTIIIIVAFGYFLKQLDIECKNILVAIICLLGLFYNEITKTLFIFLNAYALFPIIIFLTFGFYIKNNIKRVEIKNVALKMILLYICAFVMGMSGPRMMLILYLPMFLMEILESLVSTWKNKRLKIEIYTIYNGLGLSIVNGIGYLVYRLFISKAIEHNEVSDFLILPVRKVIDGIPQLLEVLLNSMGIYGNIGLMSTKGIDFVIKGALLIFIIIMIIYIVQGKNKRNNQVMSFFFWSLSLVSIYTILISEMFTERYYFMILFLVVTVLTISIQNLSKINKIFEWMVLGFLCIAILVNSITYYIPIYKIEGNTNQKQIANYLIDNNYQVAYATYWNADILKGLTNAELETGHFTEDGFIPYLWLTNKSLYNEREDKIKTAIILTDEEEENLLELNNYDSLVLKNMKKDFEIKEYNIYSTYNNPVVKTSLPRKQGEKVFYDFTKRYVLRNDKAIKVNYEEKYIESNLNGGYLVWGPYIPTNIGTYSFKLDYEVIESANDDIGYFDISINSGSVQKAIGTLKKDGTSIILKNVTFENNTDTLEYRVYVHPGTIVRLKSIEIVKED